MTGQHEKDRLKEWRCEHCNAFIVDFDPQYPMYLKRGRCHACKKPIEPLDRRWVQTKERAA